MANKSVTPSTLPPLAEAKQAEADRLNRFVPIKWVADYLCISEDTIRREIARGNLPVWRVGQRAVRFRLGDVEALAQRLGS